MSDLAREIASWWLMFSLGLMHVLTSLTRLFLTTMTIIHIITIGVENVTINPTNMNENSSYYNCEQPMAAQVTRMLLLVAGDVELNPGPQHPVDDSLARGLAFLISQASSEQVKIVISAWAPGKPTIVEDLNKFKVPVLKEALAWLWNRNQSDKVVNKKVKAELIDSLIIAIEVLLPDLCSVCKSEYCVGREETPALRCKGCHQGFHQPCLEQLLGGQTSLPQLPGSVYWLCAICSPNSWEKEAFACT